MKIKTPKKTIKVQEFDDVNLDLLSITSTTTEKLSANLEYIKGVGVEINKNMMGMIVSIVLVLKPVEGAIEENNVCLYPHQFDTFEDLLRLITKSLNRVNKEWKDETIFLRSQLNLFEENQWARK